jgi:predicted O-linked N-acetylglucosamine transferase (SPINDLY family)/glycosyltransferase involved in cell wall biosynthesis
MQTAVTDPVPLVSVICFCKNRVSIIRRCIESVLNQSYENWEFVVQDGASTDGTLELLRDYAHRDPRIKIVSEPDSGPAEAFWKVLQRCEGDYIATCLSDEELVPEALDKCVRWFSAEPSLGAITCDGYVADADGKITNDFKAGEFDFVAYLFGRYCPFWPGSFFRRQALLDIGLKQPGWHIGSLEFEFWCRLATDHKVKYVPEPISKYLVHPGQLSNTPANFNEHIAGRLDLLEKLFSQNGFFGEDDVALLEAKINQLGQFHDHARAYGIKDEQEKFARRIAELRRKLARHGRYHLYDAAVENLDEWRAKGWIQHVWVRIALVVPKKVRGAIPLKARRAAYQVFVSTSFAVFHLRQRLARYGWARMNGAFVEYMRERAKTDRSQYVWERIALAVPKKVRVAIPLKARRRAHKVFVAAFFTMGHLPRFLVWHLRRSLQPHSSSGSQAVFRVSVSQATRIYPRIAQIYDSRGQIAEALEMWRRAEPLNNPTVEGLACQAILKLPEATYASIEALQKQWAARHANVNARRPAPTFSRIKPNRKIRIGYHCSFMESDTIRFIMGRVMAAHDRSKFEVYSYAPTQLVSLKPSFDVARTVGLMSDDRFVDLVRRDEIDVFVEMTGFSPGNRFLAMAQRCAPIQISYLNHHGTSCVPNVDYILSDEVCTPSNAGVERHFTEAIYRLPNCLLCYDYEGSEYPPVAELPSLRRGYISFGCFGSGGKINTQLIKWWAELLHRVPNARFQIQNAQLTMPDNRRYMIDRFRWFGIDGDRLSLRGGTDRRSLLKAYDEVDVTLDTWPYCGGSTVAESLWQGVPVVTLKGSRFSSRYGASLVMAAGCSDLVAETPAGYLDIAATLASDPERLRRLRVGLRDMYRAHGIGNSARFARDLEQAYMQMLDEYWNRSSKSEERLQRAAASSA